MKKVIVIFGPTASGKTKLSIELAKHINGEIVSADSMQIYQYMDIGTAKPDEKERDGIKHHLVDEIMPSDEFNVAKYVDLANQCMKDILQRGKTPIIVGGTGLYISSLIENVDFSDTICDWELRESLRKEAEEKGNKFIHDKLKALDELSASQIHENNTKRVIRAIEVIKHTDKSIISHNASSKNTPSEFDFIKIGLTMDRQKLYERINQRVDLMIEKGLIQEVESLIQMGFDKYKISMQAIGYKEIIRWLKNELTYEEAITLIKRDSRRYAKRQITWFKRMDDAYWIDLDKNSDMAQILKKMKYLLAPNEII